MKKVLCLYYSRTGTTRAAMEQIAELLDAELVEITDGKARKGIFGFLGSGLDAMKKLPEELQPMETEQDLGAYEHVILGTPVWAGRCSSVVRAFLKEYGNTLPDAAYVVTRGSEEKSEEVYEQMDRYVSALSCHLIETAPRAAGYAVDTVYFGGGTPSYLGEKRLKKLLKIIEKQYTLSREAEVTTTSAFDTLEVPTFYERLTAARDGARDDAGT